MIITKTPFRISFAGGGSDLADFYEKYGGCVLMALAEGKSPVHANLARQENIYEKATEMVQGRKTQLEAERAGLPGSALGQAPGEHPGAGASWDHSGQVWRRGIPGRCVRPNPVPAVHRLPVNGISGDTEYRVRFCDQRDIVPTRTVTG